MMLKYWDDPILSQVCDRIEDNEFGPSLEEFGRELVAMMHASNGIGLAAPQVGVAKRVFAMTFPDHAQLSPFVVCNPELSLSGEEVIKDEGCLSMPGVILQVERPRIVVMKYFTPAGHAQEIVMKDMDGRVAQHETDHIDGVFFINRVSRQMKRQALREWERVKKERGL